MVQHPKQANTIRIGVKELRLKVRGRYCFEILVLLVYSLLYHYIHQYIFATEVNHDLKRKSVSENSLEHLDNCEMGKIKPLQELSEKYKPSKFGYHPATKQKSYLHNHYQTYYPQWLGEYRTKKFKFLEIGLESGQGSLLWKEYFPCAEIWGLEYNTNGTETQGARAINVVQGDQGDTEFLNGRLLEDSGGNFDLIIDDGGHHFEQQAASYKALFSRALNPGGLYIIEDIETSYWGKGEVMYSKSITRGGCSNQDTIVNRFKKVVDVINKKFFDNSYSVFGSVDHWIQQISFAQNLIFIRKKSMKDCIHEVKYRWSKRLSSDCPANRRNNFKDQRLDRDLKLMCSS